MLWERGCDYGLMRGGNLELIITALSEELICR